MTITLESITERFLLKTALESVSTEFRGSSIHAVVGENGAGKSTLAAILCGSLQPSSGRILLDGTPSQLKTPREAAEKGIILVQQRPLLAGSISVKENILLGIEYQKDSRFWNRKKILAELNVLRKTWAQDLSPDALVRNIGGDGRFFTALLGALCRHPSVLILDEPSALLNWEQRRMLYAGLRELAQHDMNIIIITHSMEEAALYTDTVTVLNEGRISAYYPRSKDFTPGSPGYIEFAVPDIGNSEVSHLQHPSSVSGCLSFESVTVRPQNRPGLFDIHLTARCGQLTLIRGLQESGLGTLENVMTAMETAKCSGTFTLSYNNGSDTISRRISLAHHPLTPEILRSRLHVRIAVIPSDRMFRGSNPQLSVKQILTAQHTADNSDEYARYLISKAGITISPDESAGNLSGGMLQRLILERELDLQPSFILLCEPLQGLDSHASAKLCERLYGLAESGCAVIVLSAADFPESFCSMIYTLKDGNLELTAKGKNR